MLGWRSKRQNIRFYPNLDQYSSQMRTLLDTCIAEKRIDHECSLEIKSTSLPTVDVGKTDTLKLSFTVIDDESNDQGVQPHQAFLRFWSDSGEEGIQPVKVSSSGKAKFELVSKHVHVQSLSRLSIPYSN